MPDTFLDQTLSHAIYFERYKTHEVNQLIKVIDAANIACKAEISRTNGAATKMRYIEIMREIKKIRDDAVEKLDGQLQLDLFDFVKSESSFQEKTLKSVISVKLEMTIPAPEKIYTAATFMPFAESETFETMMKKISNDFYSQWDMSVRSGYITGENAQVINRRVLGSITNLQPGTMRKLRNALTTNTRTMLSHYAEQTRNSIYRANEDLFYGYKRIETLDSRTCLVCAAGDGKIYKSLDNAPDLPAHHNCRGLYIPLIRGINNNEGERASVDGPVEAKLTFEKWIKDQSEERQKDFLGPSRYKLYKEGKPIGGFVVDGRILTLKELENK
jgi:hypothetical protein